MALIGLVIGAAGASTAFAHPLVDQGIRRYEGADFQGALSAYEEAEASNDLTREDIVTLLEGRALAQLALGAEDEMEAALVQLASLGPHREMSRAIPPPVREAFGRIARRVGQPLSVEATAEAMPGGVRIRAEVQSDGGDLVREVQIRARTADEDWTSGTGPTLNVVAAAGESVVFYAVAIGPGGAVLAEHGSEGSPLSSGAVVAGEGGSAVDLGADDDDDSSLLVPILIGAAAVVAVAAVIIIVVLASSGGQSEETQFGPPMRSP